MSFPDPLRSNKPLIRSKTAADWTAGDYYLAVGELGVESDTGNFKVGAGDNWADTPYSYADAASDGNTYGRKDGAWVDLASAAALQFRQGTDAERLAMDPVPASGEPIYTTDTNRFFIGDGTTTGGRGIVTDSDTYVICQPGDDLLAKYTAAKALTPGGNAKSATNRAALIIYPGEYDIDDQTLTIDTDYVDVIGLGSAKWAPSVTVKSTAGNQISFGGENVRAVGLYSTSSTATAGGAKRLLVNCGGVYLYRCRYTFSGALPDVVQGYLFGCEGGQKSASGSFGTIAGSGTMSTTDSNIFIGVIDGCYVKRSVFQGAVFDGIVRNTFFESPSISPVAGAMQGLVEYCSFPFFGGTLPGESGVDAVDPTAFGATATISNASPAVVTSVAHGLYTGMKVSLATDGALPTGLSTSTTYYVKRTGADTFELSATRNGTSIDTSSAGSGTHTVEKPDDKDAGWYSYCTVKTGDYSST